MTDQPEKLDLNSMDLTTEKKEDLLRLFPEIRTEDGKIDFERLKLALGETVDVGKERYGMNWPGKADCFRAIQTPSCGTLLPCPEESWPPKPYFTQSRDEEGSRGGAEDAEKEEVHAEARRRGEEKGARGSAEVEINDSENLIIEGDNLEVLKLLQKAYLGKVKMIYIDPPYNTGNDFIYPDNYSESMQTYLEYTGQADAAGKRFGTNSDTDGRFHSRWMNMIYPRLYLARNLLREDGVIFISIDDNEVANLRKLCDEIFGEENFIGIFVINSSPSAIDYGQIAKMHDYAIFYARNLSETISNQLPEKDKNFKYMDAIGPFNLYPLYHGNVAFNPNTRPNLYYPFYLNPLKQLSNGFYEIGLDENENWVEVFPVISRKENIRHVWRWGKDKARMNLNKEIVGYKNEDGEYRIVQKTRHTGKVIRSIQADQNISTRRGTAELENIFGEKIFPFPKSVELLKRYITVSMEPEDIVLDFFAGSGTTAHAVLDLNQIDGGNRKFILIQLPEPTGREDYPTIADITKERVRRVIQKIEGETEKAALAEKKNQPDLFSSASSAAPRAPNLGFRVFKLAESNFKAWNARAPQDAAALAKQLELHVDHIREERGADDILYEILLKSGFELTTPIEILNLTQGETKVAGYLVDDGKLLICLDEKLTVEAVRAMADLKPERVVCLDRGFEGNDQLKTNAVHIFKNAGIASFKTV